VDFGATGPGCAGLLGFARGEAGDPTRGGKGSGASPRGDAAELKSAVKITGSSSTDAINSGPAVPPECKSFRAPASSRFGEDGFALTSGAGQPVLDLSAGAAVLNGAMPMMPRTEGTPCGW
jgi:hypothetical protein